MHCTDCRLVTFFGFLSGPGVKNRRWTILQTILSTTTKRNSITQKWSWAQRPRHRRCRTETWLVPRMKVKKNLLLILFEI